MLPKHKFSLLLRKKIPHILLPLSSRPVVSDLWQHGLQHSRLPCPSLYPGVCSVIPMESVMPSNHLILCCPRLLLPSISPSIRVFSYESALRIRWPKDWSFSFSISPSSEYSGLIFFRTDWLDLPATQGIPYWCTSNKHLVPAVSAPHLEPDTTTSRWYCFQKSSGFQTNLELA